MTSYSLYDIILCIGRGGKPLLAKVKVIVDSPIELTVDIPNDKLNREDIITYLQGVMSQVVIGKSKLEFEVIDDIRR